MNSLAVGVLPMESDSRIYAANRMLSVYSGMRPCVSCEASTCSRAESIQ